MTGKRMMKSGKKPVALIVSLVLILTAIMGATAAYLMAKEDTITNKFTPGQVSCEVLEPNGKTDVTVKNTSDTAAYIRAAIVVTWQDENGVVYAKAPAASDYTLSIGSGWTKSGDYYYHKGAVATQGETAVLIESCSQSTTAKVPAGYKLHVEILAEAIQVVEGNAAEAAEYAWGSAAAGLVK